MATETNLTRVNVFPSETSYNSNKSSLANTELSLIKIGSDFGSDISNSSLKENNGYIKLANGMMICYSQGQDKGTNGKYTFPQAFSEIPTVVCSKQNWGEVDEGVRNITTTSFEVNTGSNKNTYIAIGRWENTSTTHTGYKVTFNARPDNTGSGTFKVTYTNESGESKTVTNPTVLWVKKDTSVTFSNTSPSSYGHNLEWWYDMQLWKNGTQISSSESWTFTIAEDTTFDIGLYYESHDSTQDGA